ncbi:hypothetical protein KQI65_09920 [bacterium]|nr:hypothetical protein [bacterium]
MASKEVLRTDPIPGEWFEIAFRDGSKYKIQVAFEDVEEISEGSFVFELLVLNTTDFLRAAIKSNPNGAFPDDYYGQVNSGSFCAHVNEFPETGISNIAYDDFSTRLCSEEIPIHSDWHWVNDIGDDNFHVILLEFSKAVSGTGACTGLKPEAAGDDPTVTAGPVDSVSKSVFYPIPEDGSDDDRKKLRKKKVVVIWKMA